MVQVHHLEPISSACTPEQHQNRMLWHCRLSHCHLKAILDAQLLGLVDGLDGVDFGPPSVKLVCDPCNRGKMVRPSFPPSTNVRSHHPFTMVHGDTMSPARVPSIEGFYYALVVTDDFSTRKWVIGLRDKSEAAQKLMDLIILIRVSTVKRHLPQLT